MMLRHVPVFRIRDTGTRNKHQTDTKKLDNSRNRKKTEADFLSSGFQKYIWSKKVKNFFLTFFKKGV